MSKAKKVGGSKNDRPVKKKARLADGGSKLASREKKKKALSEVVYFPAALRRLSENHDKINKVVRMIGAGLGIVKLFAGYDDRNEIVAAFVRAASVHWRGHNIFPNHPGNDTGETSNGSQMAARDLLVQAVSDASQMTARGLIIQVVASFEEFINAFRGKCEHTLSIPPASTERPNSEIWGASDWSSVLGGYLVLAEGISHGRPKPSPQVKAYLELGEMFVLLRHRTAHTSQDATTLALQRCLKSMQQGESWNIAASESATGRLPLLEIVSPEDLPNLELSHVVLASQTFHRLAHYLCHLLFSVDTEKRVLGIAVPELMRNDDLPKTLIPRLKRLKLTLTRGPFRDWSIERLRASLREHGYLSVLQDK